MKAASSAVFVASALAIAAFGIGAGDAADILGAAPPTAGPYYAGGPGYEPPPYAAPGYEPAPAPRHRAYGESRYEPSPVPTAPIYGDPGSGSSGYAMPGSQAYQSGVYAAPAPRYAPAQPCYWTQGSEPVWNGYAWSRRPVQICD